VRDKFSWFASAFLLWMIVSFIAVLAMFVRGFEGMLDGVDDAEIVAAGGFAIMTVSLGMTALFGTVYLFAPWGRVWLAAMDLTTHAVALAAGGGIALLFAFCGGYGLLVAAAAAFAFDRLMPQAASRPWVDRARIGLACCTAAVPISLNLI
jgi:hypothetical protein